MTIPEMEQALDLVEEHLPKNEFAMKMEFAMIRSLTEVSRGLLNKIKEIQTQEAMR